MDHPNRQGLPGMPRSTWAQKFCPLQLPDMRTWPNFDWLLMS
jgi:hypothetical protein